MPPMASILGVILMPATVAMGAADVAGAAAPG
jgi:hypothetical protein